MERLGLVAWGQTLCSVFQEPDRRQWCMARCFYDGKEAADLKGEEQNVQSGTEIPYAEDWTA